MLKYMWYFVYSIIFMFAERSGTDLDMTDAACRNDREPFMKLTETGYAKINLGLDVLGLRPDKYHEVAMVMQTVSLSDTVTITEGPELEVTTDRPELEGGPSNLAYKAAVLMGEFARREPRVHIHIEKRIFLTAGLAGGSTDAAAVLRGLNRYWELGLPAEKLERLGAKLGSDVPFCVAGGTALATGRGEILTPLPDLPPLQLVLAKPQLEISTPWAYREFDKQKNVIHPDIDGMVQAVRAGDVPGVLRRLGNVLEPVTAGPGGHAGVRGGAGHDERQRSYRVWICKEQRNRRTNCRDTAVAVSGSSGGGTGWEEKCMSGHLEQIRLDSYKPLRELVCEHIRDAIINGIRKLEMEGFVVMIPRRGTYVSNMSIRDINDVYEIRISLDTLAAGLAAERISDEELEELQRLLVKVGNAIEENDMAKVVEADIEFHDVLYKASRNERLRNIINNLREQITVIRGVSMRYPGRLKDTQEEHRRLVESIAARNVEKSQEAARIHLENAERTLMIAMSERKGGEELRNSLGAKK